MQNEKKGSCILLLLLQHMAHAPQFFMGYEHQRHLGIQITVPYRTSGDVSSRCVFFNTRERPIIYPRPQELSHPSATRQGRLWDERPPVSNTDDRSATDQRLAANHLTMVCDGRRSMANWWQTDRRPSPTDHRPSPPTTDLPTILKQWHWFLVGNRWYDQSPTKMSVTVKCFLWPWSPMVAGGRWRFWS